MWRRPNRREMRIAIDGRMILPTPTGIGRVACGLLRGLQEIDNENSYTVLCPDDAIECIPQASNFEIIPCNIGQYSPSMHVEIPRILKRWNIDVYYSPYFVVPLWLPCPSVITIHDTIFSVFPEMLSQPKRLAYNFLMRRAMDSACAITTDSDCTHDDILTYFPSASASKIHTVYIAADRQFKPEADTAIRDGFRWKYHLPEKYLCYVGNFKAHKNLERLILAYSQIRDVVPHHLVFVNNPGADCQKLKDQVQSSALQDRVYFCHDLMDDDLPLFYNCADLLVFPSLYEGFGLPPLEAMACGCPVITSNAASLPEVCGDAVLYCDPYSPEDIAAKIVLAIGDTALQRDLRRKGLERAKLFTWENTARQTLQAYHEALAL